MNEVKLYKEMLEVVLDFLNNYLEENGIKVMSGIKCKTWKRYNRESKDYGHVAECEVTVKDTPRYVGESEEIGKKFIDTEPNPFYPMYKLYAFKKAISMKKSKIIASVCDDYEMEEYDEFIYNV